MFGVCLLSINCSSPRLIKKDPTVYSTCPTLITFTNHTHSDPYDSFMGSLPIRYTTPYTYAEAPNIKERKIIFRFRPTIIHCLLCLLLLQSPVVNRYAVLGSHLFHSNLSMLYHNVFLMMCKAHGIRFNMKVKTVMINLFMFISFLQIFFATDPVMIVEQENMWRS